MKCMVFGCENAEHQGNGFVAVLFSGSKVAGNWICEPCLNFLVKGSSAGNNSQLSRNASQSESEE
jgi:hypothetical protein